MCNSMYIVMQRKIIILAIVAITLRGVFAGDSLQFRPWDRVMANGTKVTFISKNKTDTFEVPGAQNIRGLAYDHVSRTLFLSVRSEDGNNGAIHAIEPDKPGWAYRAILNQIKNFQIGKMVFDSKSRTLVFINDKTPAALTEMHVPLSGEPSPPETLYDLTGYSRFDLTLDICNGYLYWSSCAYTLCRIERSKLHGGIKQLIIEDKTMGFISGLRIDHGAERLYWYKIMADFKYNEIWRSHLDGTDREPFYQGDNETVRDRPTEVKKFYNDLQMPQGHNPMSILTRENVDVDCKGTNPESDTTPLPTAENGDNQRNETSQQTWIIIGLHIVGVVIKVVVVLSFYGCKFFKIF